MENIEMFFEQIQQLYYKEFPVLKSIKQEKSILLQKQKIGQN